MTVGARRFYILHCQTPLPSALPRRKNIPFEGPGRSYKMEFYVSPMKYPISVLYSAGDDYTFIYFFSPYTDVNTWQVVARYLLYLQLKAWREGSRNHLACWQCRIRKTGLCQSTPGCQGKKASAHCLRTHFKTRTKLSQNFPSLSFYILTQRSHLSQQGKQTMIQS